MCSVCPGCWLGTGAGALRVIVGACAVVLYEKFMPGSLKSTVDPNCDMLSLCVAAVHGRRLSCGTGALMSGRESGSMAVDASHVEFCCICRGHELRKYCERAVQFKNRRQNLD